MKKKDSLYLRTLSTRLKKKRDQGYAGDFDGHWEFSDTIREVREDSPSWHRWASNWSLSRVKIRRRHKRNVQRNLMKKFGVAFHAFEEALAGAEFVNHSMRNSWHLWANEAPEEETGRDLLGTVPDSIGGKHVKLLLLTAMHAHILILGEEILTLLRNGYCDGAAARTRTLYETVMKAGVIAGDQSSTGYDLAERFYISTFIEKYGKKWLTADLTGQEKIIRDSALHAWGESFFSNENNWAAPATGDPNKKRVTFRDIEDAMHAESVKHIYQQCNHAVHSGPTRAIEAAHFDRDYLFNSRSEVKPPEVSRIGMTATFLIEFGTMEILRRVTHDAHEWDWAYSAAEFIHRISFANQEFGRFFKESQQADEGNDTPSDE